MSQSDLSKVPPIDQSILAWVRYADVLSKHPKGIYRILQKKFRQFRAELRSEGWFEVASSTAESAHQRGVVSIDLNELAKRRYKALTALAAIPTISSLVFLLVPAWGWASVLPGIVLGGLLSLYTFEHPKVISILTQHGYLRAVDDGELNQKELITLPGFDSEFLNPLTDSTYILGEGLLRRLKSYYADHSASALNEHEELGVVVLKLDDPELLGWLTEENLETIIPLNLLSGGYVTFISERSVVEASNVRALAQGGTPATRLGTFIRLPSLRRATRHRCAQL